MYMNLSCTNLLLVNTGNNTFTEPNIFFQCSFMSHYGWKLMKDKTEREEGGLAVKRTISV